MPAVCLWLVTLTFWPQNKFQDSSWNISVSSLVIRFSDIVRNVGWLRFNGVVSTSLNWTVVLMRYAACSNELNVFLRAEIYRQTRDIQATEMREWLWIDSNGKNGN